jgi:biotin carboxyl carrier protein
MYKVKVNSKESFEINSKLDLILNTADATAIVRNANGTFDVQIENTNLNASIIDWDTETKTAKIKINQNLYVVNVQEPADLLLEKLGLTIPKPKKANNLLSPMPGLILKIIVQAGQAVKKGESLLILEAMKMENVFKAAADCIIKDIKIEPNQAVEKGQELISFV